MARWCNMEGCRHCTLQVASVALGSLFPRTGAVVEAGQSPGPVGFAEMAGRSPGLMEGDMARWLLLLLFLLLMQNNSMNNIVDGLALRLLRDLP